MLEPGAISYAAVVGGGRMGADITLVLLRGGCRAVVVERNSNRRRELASYLGARTKESIAVVAGFDDVAWPAIDLVVECVPEELPGKQAVFGSVTARCRRDTLVVSNSSSLPISRIAAAEPTRDRMLGWHFFYPADLVPVVEVIAGADTAAPHLDRLVRLSRRCRLVPIVVRKEVPGFVLNRLQHALTREAYALVGNGVATLEDIDRATRFGFGFRYVAAGPFLQRDHGGLDVHHAVATEIFPTLANDSAPPAMLRERVTAGKIGLKSGEGFYRWTDATAAGEKQRYAELLRRTLALLEADLEQEYARK